MFFKFYFRIIEIKAWILFLISVIFILFSGLLMTLIEPEKFPNLLTGVWWVMTTITTIGYGDIAPESAAGRLYGILVLDTFGIGLFGVIIGKAISIIKSYQKRRREGKIMYKGKNHFVVIGWTETSKLTIHEILADKTNDQAVVLIGKLSQSPLPTEERVHYVKGSPTDFQTLDRANINEAAAIMIFSPDEIGSAELTDGYSLLVATTIERYDELVQRNLYTVVEIQMNKHMDNFKYVKVDEFILSRQSISQLMFSAAKNA